MANDRGDHLPAQRTIPMIPNSLVFVDVDTQRDFLEPGGALYMPGSSAIIPNLARLTRFAISRQIPILATACSHHLDDQELRRFPPHCIAGTPGEERIAATARPQSTVVAVSERFTGGIPNHLTLQKCELDLFSRPDADRLIARINEAKPTFVVYGVATEYCVLAVASGLLARMPRRTRRGCGVGDRSVGRSRHPDRARDPWSDLNDDRRRLCWFGVMKRPLNGITASMAMSCYARAAR